MNPERDYQRNVFKAPQHPIEHTESHHGIRKKHTLDMSTVNGVPTIVRVYPTLVLAPWPTC